MRAFFLLPQSEDYRLISLTNHPKILRRAEGHQICRDGPLRPPHSGAHEGAPLRFSWRERIPKGAEAKTD
jgi:hypothetical protein